jgi:hypothetical protein
MAHPWTNVEYQVQLSAQLYYQVLQCKGVFGCSISLNPMCLQPTISVVVLCLATRCRSYIIGRMGALENGVVVEIYHWVQNTAPVHHKLNRLIRSHQPTYYRTTTSETKQLT